MVEQIIETAAVSLAEEIMEAPKIQTEEETIDVPVVTQGQVLASQTEQKTVEMPQVQFLDRVVEVFVVAQGQMPRPSMPAERIQERIVEETIDVPVPHMMKKTIELAKHIPQEEIVEVIQLLPQDRMSNHVVQQIVDIPSPQTVDVAPQIL